MDLNNLSQLHSTDEPTIETVQPDIGASWDSKAWDEIFNLANGEEEDLESDLA